MVCLDTSVLVALIRKDREAMEGLRTEAEAGGIVLDHRNQPVRALLGRVRV